MWSCKWLGRCGKIAPSCQLRSCEMGCRGPVLLIGGHGSDPCLPRVPVGSGGSLSRSKSVASPLREGCEGVLCFRVCLSRRFSCLISGAMSLEIVEGCGFVLTFDISTFCD